MHFATACELHDKMHECPETTDGICFALYADMVVCLFVRNLLVCFVCFCLLFVCFVCLFVLFVFVCLFVSVFVSLFACFFVVSVRAEACSLLCSALSICS